MNVQDAFADAGLTTEAVESAAGLSKLVGDDGKKAEGQFVLDGQPLATKEGFRNVSALWFPKTFSYEQGMEQLEKDRAQTLDIHAKVSEMVPTVDPQGKFAFLHRPTETFYRPTEHAMTQVGNWAGTGTWTPINLMNPITDYKGRVTEERDADDASCLAHLIQNGFRRLDKDKKFIFRCRKDGTMRAMLTELFLKVDNRWFMELLAKLIPGGRLSHWRGDGDTIYGNILIPDSIREEKDSDYGGMLSIGNSEIGTRRVSSAPSIFRAICMNGCIWGQTKGKGIKQVHRGKKLNLDVLAKEIKDNLEIQIPLLPTGIEKFLGTRILGWDGTKMSIKPVLAEVATEKKLSKAEASKLLKAWGIERDTTPELGHTLFGIVNAFTRAGQELDNARWVDFDTIAGEMTDWGANEFEKLTGRAARLTADEVEEAFA